MCTSKGMLDLGLCCVEALAHALFCLCAAAAEARLELRDRGGREEQEDGGEGWVLLGTSDVQLLDALEVDIEDAAFGVEFGEGREGGAVADISLLSITSNAPGTFAAT